MFILGPLPLSMYTPLPGQVMQNYDDLHHYVDDTLFFVPLK